MLEVSLESMMLEPTLGRLDAELWDAYNRLYASFGNTTTELSRLLSAREELAALLHSEEMVSAVTDNAALKERASEAAAKLEDLTIDRAIAIALGEPVTHSSLSDEGTHDVRIW